MNIEFTSDSLLQLNLILEMNSSASGFVLGNSLGKYRIIKAIFPVDINKKNINKLYFNIYNKIGEQLMGVFFYNREMFFCDWFIEDIIFRITDHNMAGGYKKSI